MLKFSCTNQYFTFTMDYMTLCNLTAIILQLLSAIEILLFSASSDDTKTYEIIQMSYITDTKKIQMQYTMYKCVFKRNFKD